MYNIQKTFRLVFLSLLSVLLVGQIAFSAPTSPGGGSPTTPGALCLDDSDTWILCESTFTFGDTSARIAEIWVTTLNATTFTLGGATTGPILNSDGTAAAPSYSFSADTNTGIYRDAADVLGFSTGGVARITIDSGGKVVHNVAALAGGQTGDTVTYTTSGAGSSAVNGHGVTLGAGYTGSGFTVGIYADNATAGTNTAYANSVPYGYRPDGNRGDTGYARATTTGHNSGGVSLAGGGANNYGMWGAATVAKSGANNIGIAGWGLNTGGGGGIGVGGFFSLEADGTVPELGSTTVALVADNDSQAASIFDARDNAVSVFTIVDGGATTLTRSAVGNDFTILNSATSYTTETALLTLGRTGNFTGVDTQEVGDLTIMPLSTITEPAGGSFSYNGAFIDLGGLNVTAAAGTTVVSALRLAASADADIGSSLALFVESGLSRFDGNLFWGGGVAFTGTQYSIGRDNDATNQLHFNSPTGTTMEWSVNDAAEMVLSATTLAMQANTITGIGTAITGTQNTALVISIPDQPANTTAGVGLSITADDGGTSGAGAAGGDITIVGGDGKGTGPSAGGDVILRMGANVGATSAGTIDFQTSGTTSIGSIAAISGTNFGIRTTDNTTDFMFGFQDGATFRSAFIIDQVATTVNNLQVVGAVTGAGPVLSAVGTDMNVQLSLTAKGNAGVRPTTRFMIAQGADVASATNLTLGNDGNVFEITGTTQIDLILVTGWLNGSEITLICNESVTIRHGIATSGSNVTILIASAANFSCTANDPLTLVLSETTAGGQAWREKARTAI